MKKIHTLAQVLLAVFLMQTLHAQVDKEFEFLDHRKRTTSHMESKIMDDHLFYVARQSSNPMTTVNLVNTKTNHIDTILGSFYGDTDLFEFSDGSFDVYLHTMFDYDVCVSGFIHVAYDNNSFQVDTFHSYILPENPDYDHYPHSVSKTRDGNYYMMDYDSLYFSDKVDATSIRIGGFKSKLFQNDAREVYIYEDNQIILINGTSFDTVQTTVADIIEIKNRGLFNDVLMPGVLETWDDNFSTLLRSWTFDDEIKSFYEVHVGDTELSILRSDENEFRIHGLSQGGSEFEIYSNALDMHESSKAFQLLSDSTALAINAYEIEEIMSDQLLFRNLGFGRLNVYEDRLVSIDTASIVLVNIQNFGPWENYNGDTLLLDPIHYDIDISYTNNSDTLIEHVNIISSAILTQFYFEDPGFTFDVKDVLQADGTIDYFDKRPFYDFYTSSSIITFGIPGADYKINNDPNRLFTTDVVMDVSNIELDPNLKLFPNPARDQLFIEAEGAIEEISLYNAQGQLMIFKKGMQDLDELDISALPSGIHYIKLKIKGTNNFAVQRFIKN